MSRRAGHSTIMKHLIWIAAFLLLTFAGDRLGGWVCGELLEGSEFRYSRLYRGGAEADLLLVGNSRGLMFYQPYIEEKTQANTLNLSYNGLPMNLARVLVEDYLVNNPTPRKMILDVTMCDRANQQMVNQFKQYLPYSDSLGALIRRTDDRTYWGAQVSHLFRYNSELFLRALYYRGRSDEDWLLDRVISAPMLAGVGETPDYTIEPMFLEDLKATVGLAKRRGIEVELVINPYLPAFAQRITNLPAFKQQIEARTGLRVKDYSQAVTMIEGFGDYQHLNKSGSRVYIDRLLADGVL